MSQQVVETTNVIIGPLFYLVPWSHYLTYSWEGPSRRHTLNVPSGPEEPSVHDLTLFPAPGEVLSLQVDVLDDVLNMYPTALSLTVRAALHI